ncbi:MAG TPA: ArsR family transcriptional regulator [Candidatus Bathyarchaeota archaeon]|nr:ArsR family transcriptional regulator [Candidatus Bathyarchaeota archaeon]
MPGYFESALKAISHPTRRKILKILSEGELGFTELMNKAGVRSSSLMSYHLNTLTPFIKRKSAENGRITYTLSKLGVSALRFIEMIKKQGAI